MKHKDRRTHGYVGVRSLNLNSGSWNQFLGKGFPFLLPHPVSKHLIILQKCKAQVKQGQETLFHYHCQSAITKPYPNISLKHLDLLDRMRAGAGN